ncbi:ABC transporter ATP-binding protein [Dysgonomonas sp. ZJ709]|uniref:ABC transporter ATP-binding protein n=1 Tax=Dysgonomonas sp. ZJ709 TaxID=2709797 RepID=UPI0013ED054E|nr:ATP-binding cassette domain-containing protein [Dysgonomonas sp. ZJ709]
MLKVDNISKSYGSIKALSDVSFTLDRGNIVGLLGVNGAGKSTLMKILAAIIHPDKGEITYKGKDVFIDTFEIRKHIGYLSEDNPLYEDMYVREYLQYVADIYKVEKDKVSSVIEQTGLQKEYKKKIKTLSKGNRQRVGIAQVLVHDPMFLILDEATSGLDPNQRESLNNLFVELSKEKMIIFSTHILQEVKDICSRFILMDKGLVVADQDIDTIESIQETFHQLINENNSR